ncbi:MAG: Na+/pantothenate symporter, partial [Polaribacter sp.]
MIQSVFTKILVYCIFSMAIFSCSNSKKQKQFTVAEYKAAAKHMDANLYGFVYNQVSASSFISGNKLLYSTKDKNGTTFILVNSDLKTKKAAFNHKKLAEALSEELDEEIEATALPISEVS